MKTKRHQRLSRHIRVRKKITGTAAVPRLTVFRSNKHMYAQLIDDQEGKTIVSATDVKKTPVNKEKNAQNKVMMAKEVGKDLAGLALKKNIKEAVFDRGGYKYHGRVKAVAEGAREGGLRF